MSDHTYSVGESVRILIEVTGDVAIHPGDVGMITDVDPYQENSYWLLMNDGQETGAFSDHFEPL